MGHDLYALVEAHSFDTDAPPVGTGADERLDLKARVSGVARTPSPIRAPRRSFNSKKRLLALEWARNLLPP